MEEGLFQLIFILVIVVASVLDAVARSRRKRQRMEEMDREEGAAAEGPSPEEARPEGRQREPLPEWGQPQPRSAEAGPEAEEGERQTADTMVPHDLWAILTGEGPPEREPERDADPERASAEARREAEMRGERERRERRERAEAEAKAEAARRSAPGPTAQPRPPAAPAPTARKEPRPTRRSDRWMEGIEGRASDRGWVDEELEVFGTLQEPWGEIPDIAEGEIGDDGEALSPVEEKKARPSRTRGRSVSPYTSLLQSGDPADLRKAVVLREILGPPAGLRRDGEGWDG